MLDGGEYLACLHNILQHSFRQLNDRLGQSQNSGDKLPDSSLKTGNRVRGVSGKQLHTVRNNRG